MLAVVAVIGSTAGLGILTSGPAAAVSTSAAGQTIRLSPAVACSYANGVRELSKSWKIGNETRTGYLWYSISTRCVWAVEVNGQPGVSVWIWNKDTGAQKSAYIPNGQSSATTGEVGDAGTQSHACMRPLLDAFNSEYGPKTCTGYF
jgi:hypothetical protein